MIPEGREILKKKCKLIYMTVTIGFQTFIIIVFWCLLTIHVGPDSLCHVQGRKMDIGISFGLQVSMKQHRILYIMCLNWFLLFEELHVSRKCSVKSFTTTFQFLWTVYL